jgi:hypothetical protein
LPLAIFPSRSWNKKAQLLWKARPFFSDRLPFVTMASRSSSAVISREVYFEWSRRDFGEQADVAEKMGLGKQTRELRSGAIHQVGAVVLGHGRQPRVQYANIEEPKTAQSILNHPKLPTA